MMSSKSKLAVPALLLSIVSLTGCPPPETSSSGTTTGTEKSWHIEADETVLPGVVLSVWGISFANEEKTLFIAGGPLGNTGYSSLAMRRIGSDWEDLSPGGTETFWWVSGFAPDDIWFVGEKGRIVHYTPGKVEDVPSGVTATLWGVYAFAPDDAWAVGGTPDSGTAAPNDIVLHWDGTAWTPETLPGEPLGASLFKVWGKSSEDLYVVGEHGTIWHRTKDGWVFEGGDPLLTQNRLFTVHGCDSDDAYAVGGSSVLHRDANGWSNVDVELGNQVNGVACGAIVGIVGFGGLKQRLEEGVWIDDFDKEPYSDLHAAWSDRNNEDFWAVGGDFITPAKPNQLRKGVVARYGY